MDKNAIKKYAVWARNELIARVSQKAQQYGITAEGYGDKNADSVNGVLLSATEKKQRQALIAKIDAEGFEQVMEEVAYTWFNRFTALRFMEVNNYLPSHTRVFTNEANEFKPQILADAISLELEGLDMDKVFELKEANKDEELYKYLLIVQCNALSSILPGMFQKIADYTELLLPDYLLREGSIVEQLVAIIPENEWTDQIQIIGWLYQFYNTEPKEAVFEALKKNVKIGQQEIPAATQIFTPDWIVRYMVDNSLGRIWKEYKPDTKIELKYYATPQDSEKKRDFINLEELKCIDPCMGSGHILTYLFDVLMQMYEEAGYSPRDAVQSIIKNNIYGVDIDKRAAQLSYFTVMMKARQYDRRFFSKIVQPHVLEIPDVSDVSSTAIDYFADGNMEIKTSVREILRQFKNGKEAGSAIIPVISNLQLLETRISEIMEDVSIFREEVISFLIPVIETAKVLGQKYDITVTNPPYAGRRNLKDEFCAYIDENYPESKMDLFSVFIERNLKFTKNGGYSAYMTPFVWLYLSSFVSLRKKLLDEATVYTYLQPEESSFKEAAVSICAFVLKKGVEDYEGTYFKLSSVKKAEDQESALLEGINENNSKYRYVFNMKDFNKIPDYRFVFWMTEKLIEIFNSGEKFESVAKPRQGMATSDNNRFLRFWYEVDQAKVLYGCESTDQALSSGKKWFPYNKGGGFHKWYGNNFYLLNYENDGEEVKAYAAELYKSYTRTIKNIQFYFKKCITWSDICGSTFAARAASQGFIFDVKGSSAFVDERYYDYILALLNSKISIVLLNMLNPSITTQVGDLKQIPFLYDEEKARIISACAIKCVEAAKKDWDSAEISWEFRRNPLVCGEKKIEIAFEKWKDEVRRISDIISENETQINKAFLEIYDIGGDVDPTVYESDMTLYAWDREQTVKAFISYAVGCMFGRYSLEKEGLVNTTNSSLFNVDSDNIIPICDDEYFEDDIVARFIEFVKVVFGYDNLEENLKYIAESLGGKGSSRDVIRNYFINGFYNDHVKLYQKRPVYWQFDSGKKNGFKCLIYMHRYQPDTIARIRTDYVHEQQSRYRTALVDLEQQMNTASTGERVKMGKLFKNIQEQAEELRLYEEKIHHLADQMISIDFDAGVKSNYEIFADVLAKIK